jgi:hypothetical protein
MKFFPERLPIKATIALYNVLASLIVKMRYHYRKCHDAYSRLVIPVLMAALEKGEVSY